MSRETGGGGRGGGIIVPLGAMVALIVACAGIPYLYVIRDYDYVEGTARELQDAAVWVSWATSYAVAAFYVVLTLLGLGLFVGLWTRWASPRARDASLQIQLKRADHMELPDGLSSLTIQQPRERQPVPVQLVEPPPGTQTVIDVPPPPPPAETFAYGVSRIRQLLERGDIVAGGEQLLVGYAGQQPVHMRAAEWGLAIIAGQSGKGKSSLAALLIAQAALAGWAIIVCDPVYNRERSLLRDLLGGISGAIWRQAVRPEEIAAAVGQAMRIAQLRLDTGAKGARVLLVLDEFATITGRKMLDDAAVEELFLTATKASGVGVHTLLIAHDLSGSWFGGQAARRGRDQATHRLICNMSPKAAEPILPAAEYAQQVGMLPVGQALYFDGFSAPAVVSFPRLAPFDLEVAAGGRALKPYAPWEPKAPPLAPPPAAAAALPPTEPLPAATQPAAPVPPTVVLDWPTSQKILDLLALHQGGLDAAAIAQHLGEAQSTVKSRLAELKAEGAVDARRAPQGRHFIYSLVRRPAAA